MSSFGIIREKCNLSVYVLYIYIYFNSKDYKTKIAPFIQKFGTNANVCTGLKSPLLLAMCSQSATFRQEWFASNIFCTAPQAAYWTTICLLVGRQAPPPLSAALPPSTSSYARRFPLSRLNSPPLSERCCCFLGLVRGRLPLVTRPPRPSSSGPPRWLLPTPLGPIGGGGL